MGRHSPHQMMSFSFAIRCSLKWRSPGTPVPESYEALAAAEDAVTARMAPDCSILRWRQLAKPFA